MILFLPKYDVGGKRSKYKKTETMSPVRIVEWFNIVKVMSKTWWGNQVLSDLRKGTKLSMTSLCFLGSSENW